MLLSCWSAKGGTGVTVVAAALAVLRARGGDTMLVDLCGDLPAALGIADPQTPGIAEWTRAGDDVPADALARLEVPVRPSLVLLPRGAGELRADRADVLAALLAHDGRTVVADCGTAPDGVARTVASSADRSVLVMRACFLALRRAAAAPLRPSEVVLVDEPWRALTTGDVADTVGAPVTAAIQLDPAVARAVDAGLLSRRLPRALERGLRGAA